MKNISFAAPAPGERVDTLRPVAERLYAVLGDLRHCQQAYGLKARHLATLTAMIAFLKGQPHTMVFASNSTLQERLNNISLRSLQRALADLVSSGLIERKSSPNGKRFARRHRGGTEALAFGFDLSPLLRRAAEINHLAEGYRNEAAKASLLKLQLRRSINVLEDALPYHERLTEFRASLRRKLTTSQLETLVEEAEASLPESMTTRPQPIQILESTSDTPKMTCSDSQFDTHLHKSDEKDIDLMGGEDEEADLASEVTTLPAPEELLDLVLTACPEVASYQARPARSWHELRDEAPVLAGWIGISAALVRKLKMRFGDDLSAVAIFCLLQASPAIKAPGAYLASLVAGARSKGFSPMRWLRRLLAASPCPRMHPRPA